MSAPTAAPARPYGVGDEVTVAYGQTWRGRSIDGEPGTIAETLGYGGGGKRAYMVKLDGDGDGKKILLYADQIRLADEP